jgi:acetyltransferase-like isoleucine patch superfamily enzyme
VSHLNHFLNQIRALRLKLCGVKFRGSYAVETGVFARRGWLNQRTGSIELGDKITLSPGVVLDAFGGMIRCADNVWLGPHATLYGHGGIAIGKHALVSMHCRILSSNHAIPPQGTIIRSQPDELRPTVIGEDVWLGAGVTVLGGVTIGDGAIIGAGAVVSHDIPDGAIALGVPATVKRYRSSS